MNDLTAAPGAENRPSTPAPNGYEGRLVEGHGGEHAIAVAAAHGVTTMFTLSGAHVFPMYDGAVQAEPPMRLLDVRHEQTAVFAAEAVGKLTRTPGLAVLTAGPGVTNGVSAVAQATFSGSPLVVVGGRAPANRWGMGSLQELDHPAVLAPVTKSARTVQRVGDIAVAVDEAFTLAGSSHRGPTFLDVPMDEFFDRGAVERPAPAPRRREEPDPEAVTEIGSLLAQAERPVVVIGTDVWADAAEAAALRLVEDAGIPAVTNGMGRGVVPGGHPLLTTRARGAALGKADLVVVVGTPLDFRLGYGVFGGKDGAPAGKVVHLADSAGQVSQHADLAAAASGDLRLLLEGVQQALEQQLRRPDWSGWVDELQDTLRAAVDRDAALLRAEADPVHPARIYGELLPRLEDDAVVVGDGAGGMSLMDVDTLVRHGLPVVMVVGNNSAWGLEKQPMQMLYGYDVVADLAPRTRYDEVVRALGGAGETVADPRQIGPALDRAFTSGVPYLVNVITDVDAAYPRSTFGV